MVIFIKTINICLSQWPEVDKMVKSHYLPSLEVKIHPPDEFQPKVQALLSKLEAAREKNERKFMQDLEKDYNAELNKAGEKILEIVKKGLKIFDDNELFKKSAEYAVNPPMIVVGNSRNSPKFKEIADISMTDVQKETMKVLIDEDKKIESLRENKKVEMSLGDGLSRPSNEIPKVIKSEPKLELKMENNSKDGPLDIDNLENFNFSFLELKQEEGKFTKPISVLMKLPQDPDASIKTEIEKVEKERDGFEKKMFTKAKEEFKLITQITIKELQLNLNHELIPFFVVTKNQIGSLKSIIEKNFPKNKDAKSPRFIQINSEELNEKFSKKLDVNNKEEIVNLNKMAYERILNLFSDGIDENNNGKIPNNSRIKINNLAESPVSEYKFRKISDEEMNDISDKKIKMLDEISKFTKTNSENTKLSDNNIDKLNKVDVSFNKEMCEEMRNKYPNLNLNCDSLHNDYLEVSSFLELRNEVKEKIKNENLIRLKEKSNIRGSTSGKLSNKLKSNLNNNIKSISKNKAKAGDEEFINVKFSAAEDSYPTIEKLVAQMFTRRDLAEKFERLKILEFETNLQKAENEMIQDLLHEELYKIMAKFGPAIEGIKEHVK